MNYQVSFVFKVGNWKIALQHHYITLIKIALKLFSMKSVLSPFTLTINTLYQKHKYESMKIIINLNHKEMILVSTTKKLQQCFFSLQRCDCNILISNFPLYASLRVQFHCTDWIPGGVWDSNILISNYPLETSLRIHWSNPRESFIHLASLPETSTMTCNTGESAFCNPWDK